MNVQLDSFDLLTVLLKETVLTSDRLRTSAAAVPDHFHVQSTRHGQLIPLPSAATDFLGLEQVMGQRCSSRQYAENTLSIQALTTCLAAAHNADLQNWQEEWGAGVNLEFLVLATRVQDLAPGLYRYVASENGLAAVVTPLSSEMVEQLVLQQEFSTAPIVLGVVGNLATALGRHGSHGYRQLLLRAGAAAHNAYLAALSLGLCGNLFAGFLMNPLRRLAGVDGFREAPLFAVALGHPVSPMVPDMVGRESLLSSHM